MPRYVQREFEAYLKCGRLEHGFLCVQCKHCHAEPLVAFSCKCRGFCRSCGARLMAESAALLVDEVLPQQPVQQWVLSFPYPLRFLFASQPAIMTGALGIVYRAIGTHLIHKAGYTRKTAHTGAVTLIQRFGSALNLNIHFHMLFLDGVYIAGANAASARFHRVQEPCSAEITQLAHTLAHQLRQFPAGPENLGKQRLPTLRNVDSRPSEAFVKSYSHNGYFKTLKQIVHFYNTRDLKPSCPASGLHGEKCVNFTCG